MTDLAAEAAALADALDALLEHQGHRLMRYVPIGLSCSLGYAVLYGEKTISRKIILRKAPK